MSNVLYDTFLPYVYPLTPLASEPGAIIAVRSACIKFCKGSLFLQSTMDAISTAAGVGDYDIDVPTDTVLTQVMTLYYGGIFMPRRTLAEVSGQYSANWQLLVGTPRVYVQLNPTTITTVLTPSTSVTNALTGIIAVAPTHASLSCDIQLFERFVEIIARGAAANLFALPDQKFSNMSTALVLTRQFNADIANARAQVLAGQNASSLRVRFRNGP